MLTLPMAWASSSSREHMKADVSIGDLNTSGGAAPPACQTAGPGVPVYETPLAAPVRAWSCILLQQCNATDTGTSTESFQTAWRLFSRAAETGLLRWPFVSRHYYLSAAALDPTRQPPWTRMLHPLGDVLCTQVSVQLLFSLHLPQVLQAEPRAL